jgi:hypothetical protein
VRQLYLRRHGVEINNKNTVRSFEKIVGKRKKRKNSFNADEDFEGESARK